MLIAGLLIGAITGTTTEATGQPIPPDVQAQIEALGAKVQVLQQQLAAARLATSPGELRESPPPAKDGGSPSATSADAPAAPTSTPTLEALAAEIQQLDQQIRIVGRQLELQREQDAERAKAAPVVGAGREGFALRSPDGNFQLRLRGLVQADSRSYAGDDAELGTDTFVLRRARPILEGTVFKNFDFRLTPDFGGGTTVLQDAYVDLRFHPAFKVRTGKFKTPFGLERLASAAELLFVERALPTAVAPNRDLGVVLFGDVAAGALNYSVGAVNGVADGASADVDDRDGKDLVARVFALPFKSSRNERLRQIGLGIAATSGTQRGSVTAPNLPVFRTNGQNVFARYRFDTTTPAGTTFADGAHWRLSPQGYFYTGPFGVLAEYVVSSQRVRREVAVARLVTTAWQASTSYVVTGEDSSYRGVTPRRAFDPSTGAWGAIELTARVNRLSLDRDAFPLFANPAAAARDARAWGMGANWYLNRTIKLTADYETTYFQGGSASGARDTERNLLTRVQVAF
jgi:phosphate-selective porin OprO/OprP